MNLRTTLGFCILLLAAPALFSQTPDREPLADEWGYRPADGSTVPLNPPSLTWVHEKDAAGYAVEWADNAAFSGAASARNLHWCVYTHSKPLKPGTYFWRYRIVSKDKRASAWSRARKFIIPAGATDFPQPTMDELHRRVPKNHPRLFVRPEDLPRLKAYAQAAGKAYFEKIISTADALLTADPTPEPTVRAAPYDPETQKFWWSNRVQTVKALQEAEILAFCLAAHRRAALRRAGARLGCCTSPPGIPTARRTGDLNCEAAKPMLHRLARAYDWAWTLFTPDGAREDPGRHAAAAPQDAWKSGEIKQGVGHLNQPYNSHGNRTWHKLARVRHRDPRRNARGRALARLRRQQVLSPPIPSGRTTTAAGTRGSPTGPATWSKVTWWLDVARVALGIDGFKKPFFAHFGDYYALFTRRPGRPEMGFGDLAWRRRRRAGLSWMHFFVQAHGKPLLVLVARRLEDRAFDSGEPVLSFLWSEDAARRAQGARRPPAVEGLPRHRGGRPQHDPCRRRAITSQIRFKSSPFGAQSHGHDPHNSFTLSAYGDRAAGQQRLPGPLRQRRSTRTGAGHRSPERAARRWRPGRSRTRPSLGGRIVKWPISRMAWNTWWAMPPAAYEGRLKKALRHVVFVKPDLIILADEVEAPKPSTYQLMLHGQGPFFVKESDQQLILDRGEAGVVVDYVSEKPLKMRQWQGYEPQPDHSYLASIKSPGIPMQWHVEAATAAPADGSFTLTVLRPYRKGSQPSTPVRVERNAGGLGVTVATPSLPEVSVTFDPSGQKEFIHVRSGGRDWTVARPE